MQTCFYVNTAGGGSCLWSKYPVAGTSQSKNNPMFLLLEQSRQGNAGHVGTQVLVGAVPAWEEWSLPGRSRPFPPGEHPRGPGHQKGAGADSPGSIPPCLRGSANTARKSTVGLKSIFLA